jgi:outer membrane protein OmpA-like peptidoglycan-associated protein
VGDNYGGVSLSVDNSEMIVTVCRPGKMGYNNCDLYRTTWQLLYNERTGLEDYQWGELENLGPEINTDDGWEAQPSLSADGQTLFFATARENSTPDANGNPTIDIYYAKRGPDGKWGQAQSVGQTINSAGQEKSPFMHTDSKTLYFSATGRPGAGGYDIYYTRQQEDGSWTEPKNIGVPINTAEDEHGLIVSTDGKQAYYASKGVRGARGLDVISFEMPEKARPEKVLLVKGEMLDEQGEIVADAKVELHYAESKRVEKVPVNETTGAYVAVINVEREDVVMTIEKEGHAFEAHVYTKESAEESNGVAELKSEVKPLVVGSPYTIHDIFYATNSAEIDSKSKLVLTQFANYLNRNPSMRVEIAGHTDNRGDTEMNMLLSQERAFEVKKHLESLGVAGSRLEYKGYGPTRPVADNSTEQGRAQNRRTEFIIRQQ